MKNNASLLYSLFLIVGDFMSLLIAFVGAYIWRVKLDVRPLIGIVPARTYLAIFVVLVPFWLIIFALLGLYNSNIYEKRFSEFGRLLVGSFIGLLFVLAYAYLSKRIIFPARLVPIYGFFLAFTFLILFRNLARAVRIVLFGFKLGITNVLIIGDTGIAKELINSLADVRRSGYRVVGVVGKRKAEGVPTFATFREAIARVGRQNLHTIIQTELFVEPDKNNEILTYAQTNHVAYKFVPGNSELFVGNIDVELFRSSIPVIAVHQTKLIGWGRVAKRLFDFGVSCVLLVGLLPFFLLISLLIFIFDPGPIFFKQKRVTRFNTPFKIYKFRTAKRKYNGLSPEKAFTKMGKPELIKKYRDLGDQIPNDPRFTLIGHVLRRLSIDELPQLINVVKGDLSLVGPRALVPEEISVSESKDHILSVKSGITGLAVVSGRRDIPYEERRKLDLYYVQNWSFWFDVVIILKTFRAVINRRGAR